ncbi:MAG: hypothetical protein FWB86_06325 [Treponema sp.]|nr:hypothetical protein [Treponema sp.]MCL2251863.1 hypothetical protein [Treponema sp.]
MKKVNCFYLIIPALILTLFTSCDLVNYTYDFINETNHIITITVNKDYQIKEGEDFTEYKKNQPILLYGYNTVTIVVINTDALDFKWTAGSNSANSTISSIVDVNTATFKDR